MLEVNNINIYLSKNHIVKDCSLTLNHGEILGLLGPNGSGKSTLLKAIYRVNSLESGEILLNHKNINSIPFKEFSKTVGVLSQFNNLTFDMKVIDMVLLGRSPHKGLFDDDTKEDLEISLNALKKVGMIDFKDKSFISLSGGEKQRVLLARVLAQEVKLLVLDEPTNHLDIKYAIEILKIIKTLNIPVIIALHDLNLASNFCTKLCIMDKGRIKYSGNPKDILTPEIIKDIYHVDAFIEEKEQGLNIYFKTNF
ncbi:ABC transporter ATP-binding protein [uncultured Clostridium sp.]|uniref:ABC transporter ATP-binding protein n=1 Tax=uncultured Clostridium sp. TaxID=59620 RepID=UPI0026151188|nr:ABC transporter ATP-binding protein [uncultured Clostridium sp.]